MIAQEEKKKWFKNLPSELREIISSDESVEKLLAIADKYQLSEDQKNVLGTEAIMLMMGLETESDATTNIKNSGLNNDNAKKIINDINEKILSGIKHLIPKFNPSSISKLTNTEKNKKQIINIDNLPGAVNLIEDEAGNKDNVVNLPNKDFAPKAENQIGQVEKGKAVFKENTTTKPQFDILESQIEKPKTSLDEKLSDLAKNENSGIVEKKYSGQDPYREPVV